MSTSTLPFRVPRPIARKVGLLRLLVRLYVCVESVAMVGLLVGAAFWLGLAVDWLFEPLPAVRIVLWCCLVLATLWVVAKYFVARTFIRLSNTSIALLVERQFPMLRESLVTTIEAPSHQDPTVFQSALLEETSRHASAEMRDVRLSTLFRLRPLVWKMGLALGLLTSIAVFALLQKESFGFWIERMQLSPQPWPRRVELRVEGFGNAQDLRVVNVAHDDDYEFQVYASIVDGHKPPDQVEIRYQLADGRRGRDTMTAIGNALPGRDREQRYRYRFKHVAADLKFDVIGGDDAIRDLHLRVVSRPQIVGMHLQCEYPAYMQRAPRTIPASGRVELPEGTRAVCMVEANKPLQEVRISELASGDSLEARVLPSEPNGFQFAFEVATEDRVLLMTMLDQDGVENREPFRLVVSVIADEPPDVSVQMRGIGSAVTPQATIPLSGQVTDDYGVYSAWFEYQVNESDAERRPFRRQPDGVREFDRLDQLDLAETDPSTGQRLMALEPGDKLSLSIGAADAYQLNSQLHEGSSPRFLLEVVTDSQLRAILEKKELGLRQRFEAIYEKMTGTRELFDRIELPAADASAADSKESSEESSDPQRRRKRDQLRLEGALQNVTQLAHETLGVADGFEQIVEELINNRVDTEQLKQRLEQGIIDPLREIGGSAMPQLEVQLETTKSAFVEQHSSEESLRATKTQCDAVLEAMKEVLGRMLELESYNELVELLRGIVGDQEQLNDQTKQHRRQQLRGLLDD